MPRKKVRIISNSDKHTYILGISCFYHDASASLLRDGEIVAAAAEERFTRIKHDSAFPTNAIKYCLDSQGIATSELDYVGFYEKPLLKFGRMLFQHITYFPKTLKSFIITTPFTLTNKLRIRKVLKREIGYRGSVIYIKHHIAHAASSFYPSPFERAALLVVDGVGEFATTSYGIGNGNELKIVKEINFPDSLGLLYSTITTYLGFAVNNDEYKVMGLAAYGDKNPETNESYKKMKKLISIANDGSYSLDMSYFIFQYGERMPSSKMSELFEGSIRKVNETLEQRHKDIAAALQIVTEEVMISILNHIQRETSAENVVLAGGVALNSVCNSKILSETAFQNVWINPDPGDGGASMGVALYINHAILGNKRKPFVTSYLGPEYSDAEIQAVLESENLKYVHFKNEKRLVSVAAKIIAENAVVGWFRGRMEWGPRALGNRSILANPMSPRMQEILNKKIKYREDFRPFAPAVCDDDLNKFFVQKDLSGELTKFMLTVAKVKSEFIDKLPGVTHINQTARVQAVTQADNPEFYGLIKEVGENTGIPVVINTSFNVNGEPIVCRPEDAIKTYLETGIDHLFVGNFLLSKKSDKMCLKGMNEERKSDS